MAGPLTTRSGIGIGSTEDEIINLFGDRIETQINDDGSVDLIFVPRDDSDAEFKVIFNVRDGAVRNLPGGRIHRSPSRICAG